MPRANSSRYLRNCGSCASYQRFARSGTPFNCTHRSSSRLASPPPILRRAPARFAVQPQQKVGLVPHLRPAMGVEHRLAIGGIDVRHTVPIPENLGGSRRRETVRNKTVLRTTAQTRRLRQRRCVKRVIVASPRLSFPTVASQSVLRFLLCRLSGIVRSR